MTHCDQLTPGELAYTMTKEHLAEHGYRDVRHLAKVTTRKRYWPFAALCYWQEWSLLLNLSGQGRDMP